MAVSSFMLLVGLILWLKSGNGNIDPPVPYPSSEFDINQYFGDWYQISDFPQFYERQCSNCTRATYGPLTSPSENTIQMSIWNRANLDPSQPSPELCQMKGTATASVLTQTQLQVNFQSVRAPYWILYVGPVSDGLYDWAVVSNPTRTTLYILSRSPQMDPFVYNAIVTQLFNDGFDISRLVMTNQEGCNYTP